MKIVDKPWGYELIWAHTDNYVGKILSINPSCALSLQYHNEKDETIYIQEGVMDFEHYNENEEPQKIKLRSGQAFHIVPGMRHRMGNSGSVVVKAIEVSTPQLNDIVRLEDRYGRVV